MTMVPLVSVALCGVPAAAGARMTAWLEAHPDLGLAVTARTDSPESLLESLRQVPAHAVVIDSQLGLEGISLAQELVAAGYQAVALVDGANRPRVRQRALDCSLAVLPDYEPAKAAGLLRRLVGLSEGATGSGRIIAFHSPRGGAGTSVLALATAQYLAGQGARTALVETCSGVGALPMLGLKAAGGWGELAPLLTPEFAGNPDAPALLQRCLVPSGGDGAAPLQILPSGGPLVMDRIGPDATEAVLDLLPACGCDYIVIDAGSELSVPSASAIAVAHVLCLVVLPDAVSAFRLVQTTDVLTQLGVADRVALVINQVREGVPQALGEVLQFLHYQKPHQIPRDSKPPLDAAGRFVGFKPGGPAAKALDLLVQRMHGTEAEVAVG